MRFKVEFYDLRRKPVIIIAKSEKEAISIAFRKYGAGFGVKRVN